MTTQLVTVLLSGMAGTGVRGAVSKVACGKVNYDEAFPSLPIIPHTSFVSVLTCGAPIRASRGPDRIRSKPYGTERKLYSV